MRDEFGRLNSSPLELEGQNTASVYMVVDDADVHYQKAIKCGAEIIFDIKDEDYGGRGYVCKDLEGHIWSLALMTLGLNFYFLFLPLNSLAF